MTRTTQYKQADATSAMTTVYPNHAGRDGVILNAAMMLSSIMTNMQTPISGLGPSWTLSQWVNLAIGLLAAIARLPRHDADALAALRRRAPGRLQRHDRAAAGVQDGQGAASRFVSAGKGNGHPHGRGRQGVGRTEIAP